ncbi:MAG TPA: NTP transferase domain-containing protein [Verrucomicrobiae bacterium]|nr:NTP transferase domain-containing protein [Verrucomicrobiae bacterium]
MRTQRLLKAPNFSHNPLTMGNRKFSAKPKTAVILAAGVPPAALGSIFGRTSSAMVPVNGRPTIHWLLHYLHQLGIDRIVLGLRHTETRLPRFVQQAFGRVQHITFVPVEKDLGPGFTLLECLKKVEANEPCLVVLGDTLFEFSPKARIPFNESFVLTAPVQDATRWCLADVDSSHQVRTLVDKPSKNPDGWPALIGVYHLRKAEPAIQALQTQLDAGARSLQLRHALQPYIETGELRAHPAGEWFDCGNLDFLTSSRRRLLQARSFNAIQIDDLRGTITKRSEHKAKFLNEINYYRLVPRDLATFFPRLVDFSLAPQDLFLTLEYYGYPTLSEIWVFEEFEGKYWESVFQTLRKIVSCFENYSAELSSKAAFDFYWNKTIDRLNTFSSQNRRFASLTKADVIELNGRRLLGWPKIKKETEARVRKLSAKPRGRIIHGDLCFTNILYDPVSRLFKFIDPRGSFGESGIYGDGRYDIAKLLHSLDGGYDFLIHDMFLLEHSGNRVKLQQFFPSSRGAVLDVFTDVFGGDYPMKEIRLLEGLLFLSMCPLHEDSPSRQVAMFATGLRILNDLLDNENMH